MTDVVDLTASMGCAGVGYMGAPKKIRGTGFPVRVNGVGLIEKK